MTQYVGEEYRIDATATGYHGETLTDAEVTSLTITILNKDKTVLVDEAAMAWDAERSEWFHMWNTATLAAGTYRYRVTITGADGRVNFEWKRTRLAKTPVIVTA